MAEAITAATRFDTAMKKRLISCSEVEEYAPAGVAKMKAIDGNKMATAYPRPSRRAATTKRQRKNRRTRQPERSSFSLFMNAYRATSCESLITSDCIDGPEKVSRNDR